MDEALHVRACYVKAMREWLAHRQSAGATTYGAVPIVRWDGGLDRFTGRRHEPVWPRLAACLKQRGIDPTDYFHSIFSSWNNHAPTPLQLLSEKVIGSYGGRRREYINRQVALLYVHLRLLRDLLHLYANDLGSVRKVLMDGAHTIGPVVRWVAARRSKLEDVASYFFAPAQAQFLVTPEAYRRVFKSEVEPLGCGPEESRHGCQSSQSR